MVDPLALRIILLGVPENSPVATQVMISILGLPIFQNWVLAGAHLMGSHLN